MVVNDQLRNTIPAFDTGEGENVNFGVLQWGPCVLRSRISKEFHAALLSESETSRKNELNWQDKLAGIIKEEYQLRDKSMFIEPLGRFFAMYHHAFKQWTNLPDLPAPRYQLRDLWVNFQKAGEFNPPHDHAGALSFVTYLRVPDELKQEFEEYRGTSSGPGGITLLYGEGNKQAITMQQIFPAERDIIIFPAWLKHYVAPFRSDVTRISVAGNVIDSVPLSGLAEGFKLQY